MQTVYPFWASDNPLCHLVLYVFCFYRGCRLSHQTISVSARLRMLLNSARLKFYKQGLQKRKAFSQEVRPLACSYLQG